MPVIKIRHSGIPLPKSQYSELQQQVTRLIAEVLGKSPPVTAVLVEALPEHQWSVGGVPTSLDQRGVQMDIYITEGGNSDSEKSAMIGSAFAMLETLLGPLLEASYVVIHEVAANAWGYGGKTQEERRLSRRAG